MFSLLTFGVVWDYYCLKLQGKQNKQNSTPKSYKSEIKILANPARIISLSNLKFPDCWLTLGTVKKVELCIITSNRKPLEAALSDLRKKGSKNILSQNKSLTENGASKTIMKFWSSNPQSNSNARCLTLDQKFRNFRNGIDGTEICWEGL